MRLDWDDLHRAKAEGYLAIIAHPDASAGLFLLNYTDRAQYQQAWDAYPFLVECRGTVVDAAGVMRAKPFRKFFNVGERPETQIEHLAALGPPEVTHKLDGSMCVLYPYAGGYRMTTRGAFTSAQAARAMALWERDYAGPLADHLNPAYTHVFELIGPENRHVVRYERESLTLIGVIETETGRELPYAAVADEAQRLGLAAVEHETIEQGWQELLRAARPNFEGYVLFWPAAQLRVKVKLEEYVRLHRIITGLNEHTVWERLRAGDDLAALRADIPEEIHPWFDTTVATFQTAFAARAAEVACVVALVRAAGLDPADRAQRKDVAQIVVREGGDVRPAIFFALDGRDYADVLWKLVEPRATAAAVAPDEDDVSTG